MKQRLDPEKTIRIQHANGVTLKYNGKRTGAFFADKNNDTVMIVGKRLSKTDEITCSHEFDGKILTSKMCLSIEGAEALCYCLAEIIGYKLVIQIK